MKYVAICVSYLNGNAWILLHCPMVQNPQCDQFYFLATHKEEHRYLRGEEIKLLKLDILAHRTAEDINS